MNTPPLVTIQTQRDHLAYCQARLDRLREEYVYYPASTIRIAEQTVRRESKYLRELERKQAQQGIPA
jgi:hypothetical protein